MFGWWKGSDWLPVGDAKAQVEFFEDDLIRATKAYEYAFTFKNKNWSGYWKMLRILENDVKDSKKRLADSKIKLKEAVDLDNKTPHS